LTNSFNTAEKTFIRKADLILLAVLLIVSITAFLLFRNISTPGTTVTVTIDGELFGCWPLSQDQQISIPGVLGTNQLQIMDGHAFISDADCPDLIYLHHSPISYSGERIVCLPNRIIVLIDNTEHSDAPDALSQ